MTVTLPDNKMGRSALDPRYQNRSDVVEGDKSNVAHNYISSSPGLVIASASPEHGMRGIDSVNKDSNLPATARPSKHKVLPPSGMSDTSSAKAHLEKTVVLKRNKATQQFAKDASDGSVSKLRPPMAEIRGYTISSTLSEKQETQQGVQHAALQQEQTLFEQKLCDDNMGVAIRKINQYGKASLRYVKCVKVEELSDTCLSGNRSDSSGSRGLWSRGNSSGRITSSNSVSSPVEPGTKVLVWGKRKDVQIPLNKVVAVRKGKTTDRARRSSSPANRILSIITDDPAHPSLDIEAPSQTDRDKFARVFSRFLKLPLEGSEDNRSIKNADNPSSASEGVSDDTAKKLARRNVPVTPSERDSSGYPPLPPSTGSAHGRGESSHHSSSHPSSEMQESTSNRHSSSAAIVSLVPAQAEGNNHIESAEGSVVSSLTGLGFDQELVEELHNALNELRAELEESRAEAARAVKVAEQAIQSAEKSSSHEWQNTVTHRAAEAAAIAQKRSAEAMAKQRLAEERLDNERKTAQFWRKQAELAEQEAGKLQTRAAAAEVQRSATEERLESESRLMKAQVEAISQRYSDYDQHQHDSLEAAVARNRVLELELEAARREIASIRHEEVHEKVSEKKKMSFGRKKKNEAKIPLSSTADIDLIPYSRQPLNQPSAEQIRKLQAQSELFRRQFELLRKTATDELAVLAKASLPWSEQMKMVVKMHQSEIDRLMDKLAAESASRRKLLHEVQDLRGSVRVYCRPRMPSNGHGTLFYPSHDTIMLKRNVSSSKDGCSGPLCFELDRIFDSAALQQDIYNELEEVCLSALDGYNICTICYGTTGSGKTHTILGDVVFHDDKVAIDNHGLQLRTMKQLFDISKERSDRYTDTFTLSIIEVHNEKLCDILAGTSAAEARGKIITAENKFTKSKNQKSIDDYEDTLDSGKPTKLEIRTDVHGETVVQGAMSVTVESFHDFSSIWAECLEMRAQKLFELGVDIGEYEASSHVISSIQIHSTNIATGLGSRGKLQFVDLAGSDLVSATPEAKNHDPYSIDSRYLSRGLTFAHRSMETLFDVVEARIQFSRSVPYRNSTLTHLLLDSLESDTKVQLVACVSSDECDLEETMATLRFASQMRRINIGKATKHTISPP